MTGRQTYCLTCKHITHEGRICMEPLYWGSKHDADCGCPDEVCFGEGQPWVEPDEAAVCWHDKQPCTHGCYIVCWKTV